MSYQLNHIVVLNREVLNKWKSSELATMPWICVSSNSGHFIPCCVTVLLTFLRIKCVVHGSAILTSAHQSIFHYCQSSFCLSWQIKVNLAPRNRNNKARHEGTSYAPHIIRFCSMGQKRRTLQRGLHHRRQPQDTPEPRSCPVFFDMHIANAPRHSLWHFQQDPLLRNNVGNCIESALTGNILTSPDMYFIKVRCVELEKKGRTPHNSD